MPIPDDLLAIMICVDCSGGLEDLGEALRCTSCGLHYPVTEGIPVMLREEAFRPEDTS